MIKIIRRKGQWDLKEVSEAKKMIKHFAELKQNTNP